MNYLDHKKLDLELKSPSYSSFKSSLIDMGVNDDNISRYLRECGFSPTILRRIISTNPSIKEPSWVRNKSICKKSNTFNINWLLG